MNNKYIDNKLRECSECKKPILGFGKTGLCSSCAHIGNRAYNYKGDEAGHTSIHQWLYSQVGKANYCENDKNHVSSRYEWSSISRKALRDVNDYRSLCPSCHRKYDLTDKTRAAISVAHKAMPHKNAVKAMRTINVKRVQQLDSDGNLIATYGSVQQAFKSTGVHFSTISSILSGKWRFKKKYDWRYDE